MFLGARSKLHVWVSVMVQKANEILHEPRNEEFGGSEQHESGFSTTENGGIKH